MRRRCTAMPSSSAIATELSRFLDPPSTTTAGAAGGQSAAVAQATATPAGESAQTAAAAVTQLIASVPQALHNSRRRRRPHNPAWADLEHDREFLDLWIAYPDQQLDRTGNSSQYTTG